MAGLRRRHDGSAGAADEAAPTTAPTAPSYAELAERVDALEERLDDVVAQLDEARSHNLRLAEIVDVVQELLVPLAHRDEARLAAALESFSRTV